MPLSNVAHEPQAVWEALQAGNQRVIDGTIMDLNKIYEREGLTKGQDPRVVVISCSDSRAPIEHVFNIGFGDAFVIRTAGHILDASVLASLDYALDHLHPNLLVVLGHQSCGAVAAAVGVERVEAFLALLVEVTSEAPDARDDDRFRLCRPGLRSLLRRFRP